MGPLRDSARRVEVGVERRGPCRANLVAQALLTCLVLLVSRLSLASSPESPDCRPPCESAICPTVGECQHGTYELCNGCCTGCAAGPGDICHSHSPVYGPCGDGLECAFETRFTPGVCQRIANSEYCKCAGVLCNSLQPGRSSLELCVCVLQLCASRKT